MDVATLVLMMTVMATVKAVLLLAAGWRRHVELMLWGAGFASLALAYAFTAARGHLPYLPGLLASNVPVAISTALMVEGLRRFLALNDPYTRWWVWGLVLLTLIWFVVMRDNLDARVVWVAGVLSAHLGWCFFSLQRPGLRAYQLGRRLIQFGVLLILLPMWWRAWLALGHALPASSHFESANAHLSVMIGAHLLAITLFSTGVLTLIQQRTQERLVGSERQFRELLEAANELMCVVVNGTIRYVNPCVQALTGYEAGALMGRSFLDYVDEQDQPLALRQHELRLLGRLPATAYDLRLKTQALGVRLFEVRGNPIVWEGQPGILFVLQDVTERREQMAEIHDRAMHDGLTHLANRHLLLDRAELALANNRRFHQHSALLFMDLDHFKPLNDTHGHAVGDLLLQEVARRLKQEVRDLDTVARFGGDEFVVLLNALDADVDIARADALELANRVRLSLAEPYVLWPAGMHQDAVPVQHHCTASIGLVVFGSQDTDLQAVLDQADQAMYQAKHQGRNCVVS